jgi:hypothetical protein
MIPSRVNESTSFIVMDILEQAQRMERAGTEVIHLEVGEPDFEVPECVSEAIFRAVKDGSSHEMYNLKPAKTFYGRPRPIVFSHYEAILTSLHILNESFGGIGHDDERLH